MQRANVQLHFLRRLRNAGFSPTELLLYYSSCIRPVLEYACPAWATSIYKYQKETLESVQKRALAIITGSFRPISSTIYESQQMQYKLEPHESRRMNLSKSFFTDSLKNASCINHIIPSQRDEEITMKLYVEQTNTNCLHQIKKPVDSGLFDGAWSSGSLILLKLISRPYIVTISHINMHVWYVIIVICVSFSKCDCTF